MYEFTVEHRTTLGGRRQQPDNKDHFDLVVEGEPRDENVSERLDAREEGENNPVHHPLDLKERTNLITNRQITAISNTHIFLDIPCADCFVRGVGGVEDPKEQSESGIKHRLQHKNRQKDDSQED